MGAGERIAIVEASTAAEIAEIRALFTEYQQWLGADLSFQNFAAELDALAALYASPGGRLLLARAPDGSAAGGVGMKGLEPGICEMKRLYVRPRWRGLGLGRRLAEAAVQAGQDAGYAAMRLDTLTRLHEAVSLYRSMGFREIPAYYENPMDGVFYLEKPLARPAREGRPGRRRIRRFAP